MPGYKKAADSSSETRRRALNLVEQITDALRDEAQNGESLPEAEQAEQMCNAIDAAAAGLIYIGDSLRQIAEAIDERS